MMKLYRRTDQDPVAVGRDGFTDRVGRYLTEQEWSGVWLSDRPLDANEGAEGAHLLELTIDATESDLADYEWIEEDKTYREWLVPAAVLNPRIRSVREIDDLDIDG